MVACLNVGRGYGSLEPPCMPQSAPWQSMDCMCTVPGTNNMPVGGHSKENLDFRSRCPWRNGSSSQICWGGQFQTSQVQFQMIFHIMSQRKTHYCFPCRKSPTDQFPTTTGGRKRLRTGLQKVVKLNGDIDDPWCPNCIRSEKIVKDILGDHGTFLLPAPAQGYWRWRIEEVPRETHFGYATWILLFTPTEIGIPGKNENCLLGTSVHSLTEDPLSNKGTFWWRCLLGDEPWTVPQLEGLNSFQTSILPNCQGHYHIQVIPNYPH